MKGLQLLKQGKVRDIYEMKDSLLMVASDRISAFDVILPDPIPQKGIILTQLSLFWFKKMESLIANHLITSDVSEFPDICRPYAEALEGRSMLVKKAEPLPVECVVRGYLSGSGWQAYQQEQAICGIALPSGLQESDRLPEPIFTPSTKAEPGFHDENINFDYVVNKIGKELAEKIRDLSLQLYTKGASIADRQGIIIADTKFEFGIWDNDLILIDEVLTPDSSRFWPKDNYKPSGPQDSFDKQYIRDYLLSINWNKKPPAPSLPAVVISNTFNKYSEALRKLKVEN